MQNPSKPVAVENLLARYLMNLLTFAAMIIFILAYQFAAPSSSLGDGKWLFFCSALVTILLSYQMKHSDGSVFLYQCLGLIVFNTACYLCGINEAIAQLIALGALSAGFIHLLLGYFASNEQNELD